MKWEVDNYSSDSRRSWLVKDGEQVANQVPTAIANDIAKRLNSYEAMREALKNCIVDAEQNLTKKERLQRIEYAKQALKGVE